MNDVVGTIGDFWIVFIRDGIFSDFLTASSMEDSTAPCSTSSFPTRLTQSTSCVNRLHRRLRLERVAFIFNANRRGGFACTQIFKILKVDSQTNTCLIEVRPKPALQIISKGLMTDRSLIDEFESSQIVVAAV